ncbi:hypothetical protein HYH03_015866 [Edaphochlamys debaryana]|uniref:ZPR1 jelly-roll domain-containing protein n=1 Tax=Edaphochlamys debaryana TaxID=47281 RepID=A0A835XQX7_9CHLO|nr:hypothetical protein HYH03_015866 [Edaphochlamys debaryana]|eukprot:KAG2485375.1 hypothetical protein HYH03_015866 [Edaphochlamys debaryana]
MVGPMQTLESTKIDLSHQEMDRLVTELENMWQMFTVNDEGPSGIEWLPVHGIGEALREDLGYEDMAEFEDALGGSFNDFLDKLPRIVKKEQDGKFYFQITPEPPRDQWVATRQTLTIQNRSDLWRVCLKSPHARVEIPELEFEISADGKKHIDSIYNHIAQSIFNLGNYVSSTRSSMPADVAEKIMWTVEQLNILLDVEKPWTWIVHDPSGTSELKPDEGVLVDRV